MIFYIGNEIEWNEEIDDWIEVSKYEECKKVKGIHIDRRYYDKPEKILVYNGNKKEANNDWYGEGKNHRVVDGFIERDFDDEFFIIEMNTLEDLLIFQDKYKINASVSNRKSCYVYNGEEINTFYADYFME